MSHIADQHSLMQDESGVASPSSQPPMTARSVAGVQRSGHVECASYAQPWFVGRHKPWDGLRAVERVETAGFHAILPRQIVRRPQQDDRIVPLFVGYLFVQFDPADGRWGELLQPNVGLLSIIARANLQPAPLPLGFVEHFMQAASEDGVFPWWWPGEPPVSMPRKAGQVGRSYRVEYGHWAGFVGKCVASNRNKVSLLLELFGGQQIPVELKRGQYSQTE